MNAQKMTGRNNPLEHNHYVELGVQKVLLLSTFIPFFLMTWPRLRSNMSVLAVSTSNVPATQINFSLPPGQPTKLV
jgi:hypothetical protein